jgi:hypothetical protein
MNVLLIGNSQMGAFNLPRMLAALSESAPPDHPPLNIGQVVTGGATLKKHWEAGDGPGTPRALIASQPWDRVVIQEIFCAAAAAFEPYATLFDEAIRKAGSKTILFATANVTEHYDAAFRYPESFKTLNDMQLAFGKAHGIPVAAAGYAWMRYWGDHPSREQILDLYHPDKGHPGRKGTYLYACLLYATITGRNPTGLTCDFPDIPGDALSPDEAGRMQKAAWDQYCGRVG